MAQALRLLDQVRDRVRFRHCSIRIGQAYLGWTRRFIVFHKNVIRAMSVPRKFSRLGSTG